MRADLPRRPRPVGAAAALLLGAALLPVQAFAQSDQELAPRARLTVSQQIAQDDGDVIGITPIDLSLQTGTRSQSLTFDLSAPLRQGDPDDDGFFGLGDRQARLAYRRFVRNASFETQLRYREADLDRLIFFDDDLDNIVTLDRGRRADSSIRTGYAFGSQAKLGGEFDVGYSRRDYSGTTDTSLNDSETIDANARIYLELTPLIRARILGSALETDSDGGTDTRRRRVGVGASMQINRLVNLDAEIAQSRIRREDSVDGTVEKTEGASVRGSLTYLRNDGEYVLSAASDPGTEGRRDRVQLGRNFERPDYDLSLSGGFTRLEGGDFDPTVRVSYQRNLDRLSRLQASLQRDAVSDIEGNEAINTSLSTRYDRQLTERSSIGLALFYRESEVQRGDREDARRAALDVSYSHGIVGDISVVAGVNLTRARQSGGTRDDSERIYLGLSRSFDFLP